jgi:uncharacterized FlaG/YvyC family protein
MGNLEGIRRIFDRCNARLAFAVDKDSGETVIRVVDNDSGEVIRQIPPEEQLELAKHIGGMLDRLENEEDGGMATAQRLARRLGLVVDERA